MLNSAEHENFSVNRYENANNSWHFHIYQQRNFHVQLCLVRKNLLVIWDLLEGQVSCSAEVYEKSSVTSGSDQTACIRRLIWSYAGHTCHFIGIFLRWLNFDTFYTVFYREDNFCDILSAFLPTNLLLKKSVHYKRKELASLVVEQISL